MGGGVADDGIAQIELLGGVMGRDSDGLEDVPAGDDRMGTVGGDV